MYQSAGHSNKLTNKFVKKYWLLLLKMIEPTEIVIFGNKDNQHCNTRILSKEKLNLSYFKFGTTHTHTHTYVQIVELIKSTAHEWVIIHVGGKMES